MAGDWIKMRTDLYRDPKVVAIAGHLMDRDGDLARYVNQVNQCNMSVTRNVMRNVTVGALVTVWGVTRHQGKRDGMDSVLENTRLDVLDELADLPGFGEALESVGWVVIQGKSLRFPRFFEVHNVDPLEEQREKNRERQRRFRDKKSNVTVTLKSNAREEKRREENIHTHTQATGFEEAWNRWCEFRLSVDGKPIDAIRADSILMELHRRGPEKAAKDIEFSIQRDARSILDSDHDFQKPRSGKRAPSKQEIGF